MAKYTVITLDNNEFPEACGRLERVIATSGFRPECVIGIESGGRFVAEKIFTQIPHEYIRLQRPSTSAKTGFVKTIIRLLPKTLNNYLRKVEARRLSAKFKRLASKPGYIEQQISQKLKSLDIPNIRHFNRILIVDDAIDSGMTMEAVCRAICKAYPAVDIRTAVITTTEPNPLHKPDYTIYNNRTLIRFPWSADS